MICPMVAEPEAAVPCGKEKCAWWNERFERCSVYVIGDRIDDLTIAVEKEAADGK